MLFGPNDDEEGGLQSAISASGASNQTHERAKSNTDSARGSDEKRGALWIAWLLG